MMYCKAGGGILFVSHEYHFFSFKYVNMDMAVCFIMGCEVKGFGIYWVWDMLNKCRGD